MIVYSLGSYLLSKAMEKKMNIAGSRCFPKMPQYYPSASIHSTNLKQLLTTTFISKCPRKMETVIWHSRRLFGIV